MKVGSKKSSIIIASEPLTEDTTTWIEVPEYSLIVASREEDELKIISQDINL
jgi:glutamine amidotransferase